MVQLRYVESLNQQEETEKTESELDQAGRGSGRLQYGSGPEVHRSPDNRFAEDREGKGYLGAGVLRGMVLKV